MKEQPLVPSSQAVSRRMSRQRRRDTVPEIGVRKTLHAMGYRFRVNYPVPGRPRRTIDVAFTRCKVAVFVDGCFWHACPEHATSPQANSEWWRHKLDRNVMRDRETDALLAEAGWTVVRVWEHASVVEAVERVVAAVSSARLHRTVAGGA